ncbi:hypothetical protein M3I54_41310 [Paraburkholderia sp. CNPSo 3274]|uniref:hypothetical protein n=1 Tax=Paraburkholderia sp. CNPSo 3274 TaxID=2940932 RepID=UPI0020B83800|nr:hypothetical protein [Paraburkholderia sp. CNPSo 3274]MCP3713232.1 hypothetical protein [Paraburkholderia sp. CNPSo 3274]
MKVVIEVEFASELLGSRYQGPSILAVHEAGDPFPGVDDLIELTVETNVERFRVNERVLAFRPDALHITLILGPRA